MQWLLKLWLRVRQMWERPPALTDDQQREHWQKDIRRIYPETVHAFKNRLVCLELARTFRTNPRLSADRGFIGPG
jgi:hypothetical protein